MHDYYIQKFDPADGVEHDRVEEMVAASWRLRRCWAYEVTPSSGEDLVDVFTVYVGDPNSPGAFSKDFYISNY
jgi:hypothetical protein